MTSARGSSWLRTTALVLSVFHSAPAAHGQCIDYSNYLARVGSVDTADWVWAMALSEDHLYVGTRTGYGFDSFLEVVDVSQPNAPSIVGSTGLTAWPYGVATSPLQKATHFL